MGFVCLKRHRQCLTGLKEAFRGQATDMSIECEPRGSQPQCGTDQECKSPSEGSYFPPHSLYLC